jgi:serine/threonine protein kinase
VNNSGDTQVQGDDEREGSRRLSIEGNQPPAEIDGYTMIRRLGTGAYGTVWLAREDNTGRMVAVKYYPHRRGLNWSLLSREVEKLATLYTSRNIVQLLDVGWNADPPYYVMEFVENGSLSAYMAKGPLATNEAVRIAKEVCRALIEAHGAGVLHCDLKPDNVLLDSTFQVRLCDFGQSRMSHERSPALGTLYYMAPEQADLEAIADARWDVYAVGALLYHMLTGEPPFRTAELQRTLETTDSLNDRLAVYREAIKNSPQPIAYRSVAGVDKRLGHLIDTCLSVDPSKRLPNAQAILAELEGREKQRARRPLLLLGVLGPLLLIAAMVPLFAGALRTSLQEMERRLTDRALESNALSARALAGAMESELEGRLTDLQRVAELEIRLKDLQDVTEIESRREELQDVASGVRQLGDLADLTELNIKLQTLVDAAKIEKLIGPLEEALTRTPSDTIVLESQTFHDALPADQPKWMQSLESARRRADERNNVRGHKVDVSWFLQNQHGWQLWRHPYSEKSVGKNYAKRDYFHGRSVEYSEGNVPADISPITEPHISLPFKSDSTGQYMVSLSVPVKNLKGNVIGVLGRTAHLSDLRIRLAQYIREEQSLNENEDSIVRTIAIAHIKSGQLLDHPWLYDQSQQELDRAFHTLAIPEETLTLVRTAKRDAENLLEGHGQAAAVMLENYPDPVGQLSDQSVEIYRQELMAAMAVMRDSKTQWVVIVQEPRANMLKPVKDMTQQAVRTAWIAVITSILLMGIVWLFVSRAISKSNN